MKLIPILAMSSGGLGQGLTLMVAVVIAIAFAWWVNQNYVPEPLRKWVVLIIVLLLVLAAINFVLSLSGNAFIKW